MDKNALRQQIKDKKRQMTDEHIESASARLGILAASSAC